MILILKSWFWFKIKIVPISGYCYTVSLIISIFQLQNMARAVKLTILIISFVASISQSCPIPADILPCTCFEDSLSRLSLTCFGIESENQLQTIFQASFPEKAFYDLYVDESPGLLSIGPIFNGVTFEVVELYRSGIQSITDDALLTSSATLTKLILKDTAIETSSFPFSTLQSYPNLEVLTIDTSNIDAIPSLQSDSLQNLGIVASNVQTLDMSKLKQYENNQIFVRPLCIITNLNWYYLLIILVFAQVHSQGYPQ